MTASLSPALSRKDLRRFGEVLRILTMRNLKVRYRGSALGVYWSVLNPVIMTAVYTAIFSSVFQKYYEGSIERYVLAVFIGLVAVNFFAGSTAQALPMIVSNGALLNKIRLPTEVFPISMVAAYTFQLLVGNVPILALITIFVSRNPLHLILLVLPVVSLIGLSMGAAFITSTLYVFFRDIPYMYELVTYLVWLTSPVFYPVAIIPPHLHPLLRFNPLFPIIESLRQICLDYAMPDWRLLALSLVQAAVTLAIGWALFRRLRRQFMDLI